MTLSSTTTECLRRKRPPIVSVFRILAFILDFVISIETRSFSKQSFMPRSLSSSPSNFSHLTHIIPLVALIHIVCFSRAPFVSYLHWFDKMQWHFDGVSDWIAKNWLIDYFMFCVCVHAIHGIGASNPMGVCVCVDPLSFWNISQLRITSISLLPNIDHLTSSIQIANRMVSYRNRIVRREKEKIRSKLSRVFQYISMHYSNESWQLKVLCSLTLQSSILPSSKSIVLIQFVLRY